jgi:hypothetical protein
MPAVSSDEGVEFEAARLGRFLAGLPESVPGPPVVDWPDLVRRAIDERVGPLLLARLGDDSRLPEVERRLLRAERYRAEASSLILYRELDHLLERSSESGLAPPVVLKGGALASSLYDEIGLRPMGDIDVLVPRAELEGWLELARKASFRRLAPEMSPGLDRAIHYHTALSRDDEGEATIELHYGLIAGESDWRSPDPRWFLESTEDWHPPSAARYSARQLDPTAHLLYLSAHAMLQHGGASARMIWFYDLHLLISRRRIRWTELLERAKSLRWEPALGAALARSRAFFETELPEGLVEELEVHPRERRAREVGRRGDPGRSRAEIVWSELRSVGVGRGLLWALGILFPRPEYMKWRYPEAGRLWPAIYPLRWGRAVWEGGRALLRRRPG